MENCATVDASASAGFEQLQSMKEFDNVDKMKVGAHELLGR